MIFSFKSHIVSVEDIKVRAEVIIIMELPKEIEPRGGGFVYCLQNYFVAGPPVLHQQKAPPPPLLKGLDYLIFVFKFNLREN